MLSTLAINGNNEVMKATLKYLAGIAGPSGFGSSSTAEQVTQNSSQFLPSHLTALITGKQPSKLIYHIYIYIYPSMPSFPTTYFLHQHNYILVYALRDSLVQSCIYIYIYIVCLVEHS